MPILNFENRLFALETAHISYIFGLSEKGFLANIYWGKKIPVLFLWSTSVSRRF